MGEREEGVLKMEIEADACHVTRRLDASGEQEGRLTSYKRELPTSDRILFLLDSRCPHTFLAVHSIPDWVSRLTSHVSRRTLRANHRSSMPLGWERLNAKQSTPNKNIVFIKPLKGADEKVSKDFLERIAAQCLPIMNEHQLAVVSLEEYEPNLEFWGKATSAPALQMLIG